MVAADWDLEPGWEVPAADPTRRDGSADSLPPFYPVRGDWVKAGMRGDWEEPAADVEAWLQLLVDVFESGSQGLPEHVVDEEGFLQFMHSRMRADADLAGGQLAGYERVWRAAHAAMGYPQHWWDVLAWVRGFPGIFCDPQGAGKCAEPRHQRRVNGVIIALRQEGLVDSVIRNMLRERMPASVLFSNRLPSEEDMQFARKEVAENVRRGSVWVWPFKHCRPHVVLALAVARNAEGKLRLILDARYVNLWLEYLPFSFETLADLVGQGAQGSYMSTWDLRAGYHHVPLAANMWPLLGFQLDGQFYVFSCLPFGLSQAPYVFTRVMQCAHEWTRSQKMPLTAMVDDAATVSPERVAAARAAGAAVLAEAALGFTHSRVKCCLWPQQELQFLGFVVDWAKGELRVPERKLARLRRMAAQLRARPQDDVLRSALGLLASCMPALKLAPMLGRWLRLAGDGVRAVDERDTAALDFLSSQLERLNGRPMGAATPVLELNAETALARELPASSCQRLVLACDASDTAYGGFVAEEQPWRMVVDMTEADKAAQHSSTLREVKGFVVALEGLVAAGRLRQGQQVQVWTDSQPAYACCVRMAGRGQVFEQVCALHVQAWKAEVELSFVWVPREHEALQAADALSKWVDQSDWRFSKQLAEQQLFREMGVPDVDCLASAQAHMCEIYYSAMYDGHCVAVDGMAQRWDEWPGRAERSTGPQPLLWVFPPVSMLADALRKIEKERAAAIVVLPRQVSAAVAEVLVRLPVVLEKLLSGPHRVMVRPTNRVPAQTAAGGWKMPLRAVLVKWQGGL